MIKNRTYTYLMGSVSLLGIVAHQKHRPDPEQESGIVTEVE